MPSLQTKSENDSNKEYENPNYCVPEIGELSGAPNEDSESQSYQTIDISKMDPISAYNTPADVAQNKTYETVKSTILIVYLA